jgi:hypothetical protein
MDIKFHRAFVSHLQEKGLAFFLIYNIGALHNLVNLERFLSKRAQDFFSIIQQDSLLPSASSPIARSKSALGSFGLRRAARINSNGLSNPRYAS